VFEIEQRTDLLEGALGRIERNVWFSIAIGLGVLGVFLGALALARARDLNRRRRQAERILGDLLRAQEEERRRIVGSLHDDIGQPLYRLLYGLEGTVARMGPDDPLGDEVRDLTELVHQVDGTLRAELRMLHRGLLADLGLNDALSDLVATVRDESGLDVDLDVEVAAETFQEPAQPAAEPEVAAASVEAVDEPSLFNAFDAQRAAAEEQMEDIFEKIGRSRKTAPLPSLPTQTASGPR